jgi:hypothetical protein
MSANKRNRALARDVGAPLIRSAAPDTRRDGFVHRRSVLAPVAVGGDDHSSVPPAAPSILPLTRRSGEPVEGCSCLKKGLCLTYQLTDAQMSGLRPDACSGKVCIHPEGIARRASVKKDWQGFDGGMLLLSWLSSRQIPVNPVLRSDLSVNSLISLATLSKIT